MRSHQMVLTCASIITLACATGCAKSNQSDADPSAESQGETSVPPAIKPSERMTYYVGIITKGESWSAEETETSQAIQTAHLDNISRLADLGLLSLAGPFYVPGKQPEKRGLFFYTVPSMDSAVRLVNTDPAVKSGQLAVDVIRWRAPAGMRYGEPVKMRAFVAAFIYPGTNWVEGQDWSYANLIATQHAGISKSNSVRGMPIYGPFISSAADGQPLAMMIFDSDSLQYVAPLLNAAADVTSSVLSYETMYWYGPVGLTF